MRKFSELEYKRPDFEEVKKEFSEIIEAFENASSADEAKSLLLKFTETQCHLMTSYQIASVRNTVDTTDKFYDGEMAFFGKAMPSLTEVNIRWNKALLGSEWRKELEDEFGRQLFRTAENDMRQQNVEIIPELIEEDGLKREYQRVAAACKTEFKGEECNFYGLLKHMEDPDRQTRREAFFAWAEIYKNVAPQLDDIYDRMIKVRCSIAKKLGLDSFITLAYMRKDRFDYGPDEVESFRRQVREVIVPACARIREKQAKRIGVDRLRYYDESFMFGEGNPTPHGTPEEMVAAAQQMYRELSPETGEFFDFMVRYQLFDLVSRPGKRPGGYCTALADYRAPFIFSNFNGTSADVDVLTHEAGHAFEGYTAARSLPLATMAFSTSEINEIHSMSMEHFTYPWMDKFFGDDADRYRWAHLTNALLSIPYLVSVDEFQHRVFENPSMSADERRETWKKIEQAYLPWRDYDGEEYMSSGGFWMQKQHIFLFPFYYIDYALAQIGAFEFYGRMKKDFKSAWEGYLNLCRSGGSRGYFETLEFAGLTNPFGEGAVKKAVDHVIAEIEASPFND